MIMLTALSIPLVTGAAIAFWMLAPVMILGALGMILARKPVHSALCLAAVMISVIVLYALSPAHLGWNFVWLIVCGVISLAATITACMSFLKEEHEKEMREKYDIVDV